MFTFSINRWCQVPPCGGNWNMYTSRSSGQNALRTWPLSFLLITRCCFTLCKEWISLNSFLCIFNKNCHQANGDNRHLVPNVPIGLGRDIRDMPIACPRTHPDANKHARHIPMYRPVHSGHANKCSPCVWTPGIPAVVIGSPVHTRFDSSICQDVRPSSQHRGYRSEPGSRTWDGSTTYIIRHSATASVCHLPRPRRSHGENDCWPCHIWFI